MRAALSLVALLSLLSLIGCGGAGSPTTTPPGNAPTTTTLNATPNPATAGATVTLTASVFYTTTVPNTPGGTVTFLDGTTTIGTATLGMGTASITTGTLAVGTHSLTASYSGSSGVGASTSTAVALVVNAPAPAATTTTLAATPNPAPAAAAITLTATITSTAAIPTGSIAFFDGSTNLGTGTINASGVATLSTSTLSAGATHKLTATYGGTTSFAPSTSAAVSLVVNAAVPTTTTTALTATPNPAAVTATVTLTATVTSVNPANTPTGSVSFYDGTTLLATVALGSGSGATATAVTATSTLAAGTHSLTAGLVANTSFAASTSAAVALAVNSSFTANATFNFATPHQTIAGFGGAEAFYASYLDSHPNESQIMAALFDPGKGLGITFLRLQNNYYLYNGSNASTFDSDDTKIVTASTSALGSAPTVLMSSWTPPASLKSNNSINGCTGVTSGNCTSGFGTLAQTGGAYNYSGFGQFWLSSLKAYAALGVTPNYISIQNEPDFPATYVACLFNPTEAPAKLYGSTAQSYASYGLAFDATYKAINASGALTSVPQMIGPESFSLYNAQALLTQVPANELAVVAHHLYNVSSYSGNPQGQLTPMTALEAEYPTSLKFATEYFQTPGFYNAIDIHNALTVANDNVYLYWALAWPSTLANGVATDQQGLLYIDNPFAQSTWAYPSGWTYNDAYYALKGYSFFIRPGYIRYDATSSNADEDISVYRSPDAKTTVMVILNTSTTATDTIGLDLSTITHTNSTVYRSSFATAITSASAERWNNLGAYTSQGISLPPQSEVTVVLTN